VKFQPKLLIKEIKVNVYKLEKIVYNFNNFLGSIVGKILCTIKRGFL